MESRKKLAIIDGKSVFYRGYYAMPGLSTADGTPTGGVYGFAAMALELIKRLKPDYVCVAWDKPKTNIRKRLAVYPDYKAGRKPAPPDFYVQIPILHELLRALNWPLYELDDYEADDIMCGLAKKADAAGLETMLITSDLDALQCISENTHVYALKKGLTNIELYRPEQFRDKYGLEPEQFLDLKALKGDSSDNIPGVPGIGEKTAVELLKQYKTLDGVYENVALTKGAVQKKLEAGRDSAYMSKEIARLYADAPIELDLEQMDINKLDTNELASILKRLEFRSLLRNLPQGMRSDSSKVAVAESTNDLSSNISAAILDLKTPTPVYVQESSAVSSLQLEGDVVIFARSSGKHGHEPTVLALSDKTNCYIFDLRKSVANSHLPSTIDQLLNGKAVTGHDLKNIFQILLELGIENLPQVAHDTQVGAFIVNSLRRDFSLTALASEDLAYAGELDNIDDDEALIKLPEICAVIRGLAERQGEQMSEVTSLIKMAEQVDWPVIPVLARIERTGVKIEPGFFKVLSDKLTDQISDIEQTIYGYADQEFNISSPSQLSDILFVKLNLPTIASKKGKAGHFSTASNVLAKLKDLHPIINDIEKYREYTKLKSTYVDTLPEQVDEDNRIHTTLALTVAATGRLSSNDPNLQNIPIRTEIGREIRTGFIVEPGNVLVSADYSQFELRIAAALSGDQAMIESFNSDRDIHIETAALVQGVKPEEVSKEMRYAAKAVNFGILYGQGVHGLSEGTGMSYADSKKFIDKYFEVRPKLKAMMERFRDQAKNKGFVETPLGRRRPTPDASSSNFVVREAALRAAINMPIQGGAADITKMAMSKLESQFRHWNEERGTRNEEEPRQILQIHDSILVECAEADAEQVGKMMKQTMENIYPELGVKLRVDISTGKTWGEL